MSIRNQVRLIGNLGHDLQVKDVKENRKVVNFDLATTERFSSGDKKEEFTEWHKCSAWGKIAENIVKNCKKGSMLAIDGSLHYKEYTDSEGVKRKIADIHVESYMVL